MKPGSSTSASSRSRGTSAQQARPGRAPWRPSASGSTHRNRSRVCASHDQRRFMASSSSAASSGGSDGRTVKLRRAFIRGRPYPPPVAAAAGPDAPAQRDCSRPVRSAASATRGSTVAQQVRAVVAKAVKQPVSVEMIEVPDPGPGEALVQVQACGVCHTDLHYREGGINDEFPFLLGHEAAGRRRGGRPRRHRRRPGRLRRSSTGGPCAASAGRAAGVARSTASPPTTPRRR